MQVSSKKKKKKKKRKKKKEKKRLINFDFVMLPEQYIENGFCKGLHLAVYSGRILTDWFNTQESLCFL